MKTLLFSWFFGEQFEQKLARYGIEESSYASLRGNTVEENEMRSGEVLIVGAIPAYRSFGSQERTVHHRLTGKAGEPLRLKITRIGNEYYWKSRKNAPLSYHSVGPYHYFSCPGAYVKLCKIESEIQFTEHFSCGMITFSLWGSCSLFDESELSLPAAENDDPPSSNLPTRDSPGASLST